MQELDAILEEASKAGAEGRDMQAAHLVQWAADRALEQLDLLEAGPQVTSAVASAQAGSLWS